MYLFRCYAVVAVVCLCGALAYGQDRGAQDFPKLTGTDWPWWRGPSRNGIAANSTVPTKFSDREGFAWKTPIPGRGHSSPVVVGERIFLTTAEEESQVHRVLALDRTDGKVLWDKEISRGGFPANNHPKNTEATPTIASDGERLFAVFFHHESIYCTALDFAGKKQWEVNAGHFNPKRYEYGYAPSPLLYKNTVIIAAEYDGKSFLVALDRASGKEVWRTPRPVNVSFSSPVVAHAAGKDQLFISGADEVASYDPATGKPLWSVKGTTAATCGTVVWDDGTIFASGGYPGSETLAIRADGSSEVLWRNNQKCYEQSMMAINGHLYALTDNGVLYCWQASDGKERWKQRLKGPISASPVLAGGHIYWANELGTVYVFKPNPERLEIVAENKVGDSAFASPAVSGNALFLRVGGTVNGKQQEYLYCFGKP